MLERSPGFWNIKQQKSLQLSYKCGNNCNSIIFKGIT
jgi:hypothetical protein